MVQGVYPPTPPILVVHYNNNFFMCVFPEGSHAKKLEFWKLGVDRKLINMTFKENNFYEWLQILKTGLLYVDAALTKDKWGYKLWTQDSEYFENCVIY